MTISGTSVDQVNGRYLLTSVRLRQSNGLGTLLAALRPDREVVRAGAVIPRGVDPEEYVDAQREAFTESRRLAAAAAARAAGSRSPSGAAGCGSSRSCPTGPRPGGCGRVTLS